MKPKLDKFHYHEMTDRVSCLLSILNDLVSTHPVAKSDFLLRRAIDGAEEALSSLYQVAADVEEKNT